MNELMNFEINFQQTKHSTELIMSCFKIKPELTKKDLREMTGLSYRTLFGVWVPRLIATNKLIKTKQGTNIIFKAKNNSNPLLGICSECDKILGEWKQGLVCTCGCDNVLPISKKYYDEVVESVKNNPLT